MKKLENGKSYANMYIIFVDASGHSTVVSQNPVDVASRAYDIMEKHIIDRLSRSATSNRCSYYERWGWQGDGGLFMIHDEDESVALKTAMHFTKCLLDLDLPALQKEFEAENITGELHIRIAVHKGTLTYISDADRGSIHSTALNHTAHLEKATPRDCISVTSEIYGIMRNERHGFYHVGIFEGHNIALYSPNLSELELRRKWYAAHGLLGVHIQALEQRPSEKGKAEFLSTAQKEVVDIGTALRTCSQYLISTQRPAIYRDTVLELLRRGCKYKCYLLDPDCDAAIHYGKESGEDLPKKIRSSIEGFKEFRIRYPNESKNLEIYTYQQYTGFALLGIDVEDQDAILLYSPYLNPIPNMILERADLPHYLVDTSNTNLFKFHHKYITMVRNYCKPLDLDD